MSFYRFHLIAPPLFNSAKNKTLNRSPYCNRLCLPHRDFKTRLSEGYTGMNRIRVPLSDDINSLNKSVKSFFKGQQEQKNTTLNDLVRKYRSQTALQEAVLEGYVHNMVSKFQNSKRFLFVQTFYSLLKWLVFLLVALFILQRARTSLNANIFDAQPSENVIQKSEIKFDDVQGCDEAKDQLRDVVEFLRHPEKFNVLGAKLPKGVLLVGPPGVGKTLLARAVAGEANVTFMNVSGSQFDGPFVGLGASRIRRIFKTARENAPCIMFIDEFDALGRKRTNQSETPYANQTINQLLAEMDGMRGSEGIIILAATNLKNNLDKAVLRPGRFDLEVHLSPPTFQGRVDLFLHYMRKIRLHQGQDTNWREIVEKLARSTAGFTGADVNNVVNQAAIRAALLRRDVVIEEDLWYALNKITMGPAKSRIADETVNVQTAYHEAGHALVHIFNPNCFPLNKVTIIPRNASLGHTSFLPQDTYGMTKAQLKAFIDVAVGGRVAEELIYGREVGEGAQQDFETAMKKAEDMVTKFGMSEKLGPRHFQDQEVICDATKQLIESEVRQLLSDSYKRVRTLLTEHSSELKLLADALLKYETLDCEDVKAVLKGEKPKLSSPSNSSLSPLPIQGGHR